VNPFHPSLSDGNPECLLQLIGIVAGQIEQRIHPATAKRPPFSGNL